MELDALQEERARRLHEEAIVLLAHDHFLPPQDLNELQQGRVTAKILMSLVDVRVWASDPEDYRRSITEVDGWFAYAQQIYGTVLAEMARTPQLMMIRGAQDVLEAKRQGKIGILLGSEGGKLVEYRLENLATFYGMGLRHMMLCWAYDSQLTAGELNTTGQGLTELGRQVVPEMNRLGIVIDITHLSRPAMREVLELSSRPVLNSHSTLKSISHRIPAMTEEEIKTLADKGGVFALHFMTHMLTGRFEPRAELEELLAQVNAIVNIGGIDCLALGPDYLPYTEEMKRNTNQWNLSFPVGLESPATLLNLTRALVWGGYSDQAVHKILGGNLLRLLRETLN